MATNLRVFNLRSGRENIDVSNEAKTAILEESRVSTRSVLGQIRINSSRPFQTVGVKKEITKPVRGLTKQKAVTSLRSSSTVAAGSKSTKSANLESNKVLEDKSKEVVKAFSAIPFEDIDKDDKGNPQLIVEYVNEIYVYMKMLESQQSIYQDYIAGKNTTITSSMRKMLIDWLVEVHVQFSLLQETLYLTVFIIDRFLQVAVERISRKQLQLVGVTAMFIASKYEEMYAPEIGDFVYITDNAYTVSQILAMEMEMLVEIEFNLGRPLPLHFLRRNSKAAFVDAQMHNLAKYVMELSILDYKLAHIPPSVVAAGSLALAMCIMSCGNDLKTRSSPRELWTNTLRHYTGYDYQDISMVVEAQSGNLKKMLDASSGAKMMAIRKKYTHKKFLKVSTIPELSLAPLDDLARGDWNPK